MGKPEAHKCKSVTLFSFRGKNRMKFCKNINSQEVCLLNALTSVNIKNTPKLPTNIACVLQILHHLET